MLAWPLGLESRPDATALTHAVRKKVSKCRARLEMESPFLPPRNELKQQKIGYILLEILLYCDIARNCSKITYHPIYESITRCTKGRFPVHRFA